MILFIISFLSIDKIPFNKGWTKRGALRDWEFQPRERQIQIARSTFDTDTDLRSALHPVYIDVIDEKSWVRILAYDRILLLRSEETEPAVVWRACTGTQPEKKKKKKKKSVASRSRESDRGRWTGSGCRSSCRRVKIHSRNIFRRVARSFLSTWPRVPPRTLWLPSAHVTHAHIRTEAKFFDDPVPESTAYPVSSKVFDGRSKREIDGPFVG